MVYSISPSYGEHLLSRGINTNGYPNHTKQHIQPSNTCGEHLLSRGINTDVYLYNNSTIAILSHRATQYSLSIIV